MIFMILRILLALGLLFVGALKLLDNGRTESYLPIMLKYLIAGLEAVLGVLIMTRWVRPAALVACFIFSVGVIVSFSTPDQPCGCFGRFSVLLQKYHVVIASLFGLLAAAVYLMSPRFRAANDLTRVNA